MGNGKIYLEIEPEVSDLDPTVGTTIQGTTVAGRSTQNIHTAVRTKHGQTLALGGLNRMRCTAHIVKVPILGSIPIVGACFSSKQFQETERELVVLVTPHVVDPMACDQVPKYVPGQETRSPDDFELFLEGIMEAPRGPRDAIQDGRYVPAYKKRADCRDIPLRQWSLQGWLCPSGSPLLRRALILGTRKQTRRPGRMPATVLRWSVLPSKVSPSCCRRQWWGAVVINGPGKVARLTRRCAKGRGYP